MKKILLICLLAYLAPAAAQEKIDKLSKSIEDKNFAFVVSEIKKKPGFNGSSGYNFKTANFTQQNPSTLSTQTSKMITSSSPVDNSELIRYYRLSALDGSYFTAYNIDNSLKSTSNDTVAEAIYLIQKNNELLISTVKNPNSVNEIMQKDFYAMKESTYKLKHSKKNKSSQVLTYILGSGNNKSKIYLEIFSDGKATLQQEAKAETTTFLNGYIKI